MSLTVDIILYLILGLFGLETTRRVVRKFAPGANDLYFDLIYLVILLIGAALFFPKAIAERELREAQSKNEKALSTTQDELKNTNQLLDNTRSDQGKTATELTKAQKDLARAQEESEKLRKENLMLQADEDGGQKSQR